MKTEKEEIKKMKVTAMPYIELLQKEERGYISESNILIARETDDNGNIKAFLYIMRNSGISWFPTGEYCIPILKIGDGLSSGDFYLELPNDIFYETYYAPEVEKKSRNFLPRVEIEIEIPTLEEIVSRMAELNKSLNNKPLPSCGFKRNDK